MLLDLHRDIPAPDQRTNAFIALRPPRPIAEQLHARATQLCSAAQMGGRQRPFVILHMTVLPISGYLGRLPRRFLEAVDAAISMVQFPAIEIVLDEAGSFDTKKDTVPFVLKGDELTDVWALGFAVQSALQVKGLNIPARRTFSPHVTLAYSPRRFPNMKVEPFSWKACEFQLIESWVGRTKYVELTRWMLRDDEPPRPKAQRVRLAPGNQSTGS